MADQQATSDAWRLDSHALLKYLEGGEFAADVRDHLQEVVDAVIYTRKKGSVTVKLDVAPQGGVAVSIVPSYSKRVPHPAPQGTVVYSLEGEMYRQDPRQLELDAVVRRVEQGQLVRADEAAAPAVREAE